MSKRLRNADAGIEAEPRLRPLPATFYDRDVADVARGLLGRWLTRDAVDGRVVGRIVEAEAYLAAGDSASHSHRGPTRRNASMFGPPGRAYVYAIHSRWCVNAATQAAGVGSAVLIRAVEPLVGLDLMAARRGRDKVLELARGPARLCEAFAIDKALDGVDLTTPGELWIGAGDDVRPEDIRTSPRVGVTSAEELPLRFFIADCRFVSGRRMLRNG